MCNCLGYLIYLQPYMLDRWGSEDERWGGDNSGGFGLYSCCSWGWGWCIPVSKFYNGQAKVMWLKQTTPENINIPVLVSKYTYLDTCMSFFPWFIRLPFGTKVWANFDMYMYSQEADFHNLKSWHQITNISLSLTKWHYVLLVF